MDQQTKTAIGLVSTLTKQVMTLSTGTIALTVTFLKDFVRAKGLSMTTAILFSAWFMLLFSILCGIFTLQALVGAVVNPNASPPTIFAGGIRIPASMQVLALFLGLILTVSFGVLVVLR